MEKKISYCGLVCSDCPAYIATQENDDQKRTETSVLWSKEFNADIPPEAINCDGCRSTGRLFQHCTECPIRLCAIERKVETCAHCKDFACEKLAFIFNAVPDAKAMLESIKAGL